MNLDKIIENNPWVLNLLYSLIAIVATIIIYFVFTNIVINKLEKRYNKKLRSKKTNTYIKLFKSVTRYIFIIVLLFVLLKINGVNITAMATGVGVFGIIFGFAIQDAIKDVIKGIDIITDSYYQVGDIIRIDKYTGKVLAIGIKTTKLEDIFEKNIVSISNRNIEKVEVLSHMINIDIPLPYDLSLKDAESTIKYITKEISKIEKVENVEYRGVNDFADSSIKYQIKVYCPPIDKVQTRRDSLTCILKCLEEKNISIPFTQIDIHQK
jgi:small conductance mechanosensitive channel